jgi:hypothetical protein
VSLKWARIFPLADLPLVLSSFSMAFHTLFLMVVSVKTDQTAWKAVVNLNLIVLP